MTANDRAERAELTLEDMCESCGLSADELIAYLKEGLVDVEGDDKTRWRFTEIHLIHFQKVVRLERDLRLNPAGAVLALELLGEIESLKKRLKLLED
jgi:chaperone modulatory protein CbpM